MGLELWASGFNAWGQLDFEGEDCDLPADIYQFKCILRDDSIIKLFHATLSATLVQTSAGSRKAGYLGKLVDLPEDRTWRLAVAGNDRVAERGHGINEYENISKFIGNVGHHHNVAQWTTEIVANQTSFTALSSTGEVYTWGDPRYESTLGRDVSPEHPASTPSLVSDLSDLPTGPIRKISSGGYITAALTKSNDLYLWGGRAGQAPPLIGLSGEPTPFDLNGEDVLDVAVGNDHILALSTEGRVYVVGNGSNGQLGLGACTEAKEWTEVEIPLAEGQRIVSVWAGYKTSFVLLKNENVT